ANDIAKVVTNPLSFLGGGGGPPPPPPQDPRVLAPVVSTDPGPPHGAAHLEAITRGIKAGDPVLFEQRVPVPPFEGAAPGAGFTLPNFPAPGGVQSFFDQIEDAVKTVVGGIPKPPTPDDLATARASVAQLVKVTGYTEEIWYANAPQANQIGRGPPVGPPVA